MIILPGDIPIAVRQTCTAKFDFKDPQKSSKDYVPEIENGIIEYVDPDNHSLADLDQGGIFDFGAERAVLIRDVRAKASAGNIGITVGTRGNTTHDVIIYAGVGPRVEPISLIVMPHQVLKLGTASAGWIEVYVVKGDAHV